MSIAQALKAKAALPSMDSVSPKAGRAPLSKSEILAKLADKGIKPRSEIEAEKAKAGDKVELSGKKKPVDGAAESEESAESSAARSEKLKKALNSNMVQFSSKERDVLSKILNK